MTVTKHKPMKTTAYDGSLFARVPVAITFEIDWDKLSRMLADKAYRSKGGKTTLFHSAIVAKTNITKFTRGKA